MTSGTGAWKRLSERLVQRLQADPIMSDHLRLESAVHFAEIVQLASEPQIADQLITEAEVPSEALGAHNRPLRGDCGV